LENVLPPDVMKLINDHPFTVRYKTEKGDHGFLVDTIDDVERLRSYTDLLERFSSLMRVHVKEIKAERSAGWKETLEEEGFYDPELRVCPRNCLGFSKGAKIYEVDVPVFHLQIAEIDGTLKIISARTRR
jgi:hypothetical protein